MKTYTAEEELKQLSLRLDPWLQPETIYYCRHFVWDNGVSGETVYIYKEGKRVDDNVMKPPVMWDLMDISKQLFPPNTMARYTIVKDQRITFEAFNSPEIFLEEIKSDMKRNTDETIAKIEVTITYLEEEKLKVGVAEAMTAKNGRIEEQRNSFIINPAKALHAVMRKRVDKLHVRLEGEEFVVRTDPS